MINLRFEAVFYYNSTNNLPFLGVYYIKSTFKIAICVKLFITTYRKIISLQEIIAFSQLKIKHTPILSK